MRKLGLSFSVLTHYYGCFRDGKLVGVTGILWYQKKAVFKNHYVFPEFRNTGVFNSLFEHSVILVKEKRLKLVEANCSQMSLPLYLKMGATVKKQFKDWTKVELIL
jgi:hypothetical protein